MAVAKETRTAVQTAGLRRSFGQVQAVAGLDVSVPAGEVVALVGPNGAGKTTLLLILAGLLAPDGGSARVGGLDPVAEPFEVHRIVGWMPDFFGVYDSLTPVEYLEFFAAAHRLPRAEWGPRARELIATVELEAFAERPVHVLSRGQKQRLGFARALVHRPTILLLDEPASGLDPRARIDLRNLVRAQKDDGVSVIVSSHILAELQEMSDSVLFMSEGRSRGFHHLDDLPRAAGKRRWRLRALDRAALQNAVPTAVVVGTVPDGAIEIELDTEEEAAEVVAALVTKGIRVVEMTPLGGGLEAAFMGLGQEVGP